MRIAKTSTLSLLAAATMAVVAPTAASAAPNPADSPNQAMARAYIDALVSHDASAVVFTPTPPVSRPDCRPASTARSSRTT